ncbi:AcrR family transcriptional regulator [Marmoricola sp. OAE513]|uniref:TetR/AcrR family transcriptional regulator n=1 Tax=Marmoricola sp. OAE513 TaxID=2817894 RepID=UPI001D48955F
MTSRMTQAERRASTRAALLVAGRRLFAERGYDDVAAEEIVTAAGVSRGALYHHFDGKAGLFEAVFVEIEAELVANFPLEELVGGDPFAALRSGVSRFLDLSLQNEVQRIALIDAPAVLGWTRWHQIEADHGLGLIRAGLDAAVAAKQIKDLPTEDLANALLGSLTESALAVARAENREAAHRRAEQVLVALLDGLSTDR